MWISDFIESDASIYDNNGLHECITCMVFGDVVFQLATKTSIRTKSDLLKCQPITEIKFVIGKKIITIVLHS